MRNLNHPAGTPNRGGDSRARLDPSLAHRPASPAFTYIIGHRGDGGRRGPLMAYEWSKMKTPTRILVGGPAVPSAFVLMGLALARKMMMAEVGEGAPNSLLGAIAAVIAVS